MANNVITINVPAGTDEGEYYIVANIGGTPTIVGEFNVADSTFPSTLIVPISVSGTFNVVTGAPALGEVTLYHSAFQGGGNGIQLAGVISTTLLGVTLT